MNYSSFRELITSKKLALTNERALATLVENYIKYRLERADQLDPLPEDKQIDPQFWNMLTPEEKKKREEEQKKEEEKEFKQKQEEEKKL